MGNLYNTVTLIFIPELTGFPNKQGGVKIFYDVTHKGGCNEKLCPISIDIYSSLLEQ
jgi:hypothetical protein